VLKTPNTIKNQTKAKISIFQLKSPKIEQKRAKNQREKIENEKAEHTSIIEQSSEPSNHQTPPKS